VLNVKFVFESLKQQIKNEGFGPHNYQSTSILVLVKACNRIYEQGCDNSSVIFQKKVFVVI